MALDYVSDHIERQADTFISQFKNKANLRLFLEVLLEPFQELEDTFNKMFTEITIAAAVGQQLDLLGNIVGRTRGGFSDSEYRDLIRLQVGANVSKGNIEPLKAIVKQVTNSTFVDVQEVFPAGVTVVLDGDELQGPLLSLLEQVVSAGVDLTLSALVSFPPFAFEGTTEAGGFGTIHDPLIGGHFVDRIEV